MSVWDTLAWARRVRTGSPGRKAVLMVLAEHADEANSCFPSQALLADATEQSVRTVRRQLQDLVDLGLVVREARTRRDGSRTSDRFWLQVPPVNLTAPPVTSGPGPRPPVTAPPATSDRAVTPTEPPAEPPQDQRATPTLPGLPAADRPSPDSAEGQVQFDRFWQAYPRKTDKGAARRAWAKAVRNTAAEVIIAGAERYAADPNREDAYTKHASTWLRAEAWDNPPLPAKRAGQRAQPKLDTDRDAEAGRLYL